MSDDDDVVLRAAAARFADRNGLAHLSVADILAAAREAGERVGLDAEQMLAATLLDLPRHPDAPPGCCGAIEAPHTEADRVWCFRPAHLRGGHVPVRVLAPRCPVCGTPPQMLLSPQQAFCSADGCRALMWDMTREPAGQLANEQPVRLLRRDLPG